MDKIKQFLEADALRERNDIDGLERAGAILDATEGLASDLAKMVEDMRVASESIIEARRLIDSVDNALADAFMYDALTRLKPYEKLFEKEGER